MQFTFEPGTEIVFPGYYFYLLPFICVPALLFGAEAALKEQTEIRNCVLHIIERGLKYFRNIIENVNISVDIFL